MSSYLIPFIQTGFANSNGNGNSAFANTANFANYAGNVTISSQPNITSVGNLISLTVDGNLLANNLQVTNNIVSNGNVNLNGPNVSLGSVSNLHITGGTSGYVLQTDGSGNLSWVAQSGGNGGGNGSVAGTNTEVQYNNAGNFGASAGFTFNSSSNTFNVPANITSTTNNGNLYMTGWSNVTTLTNPSLFFGNLTFSPGDTNVFAPNGTNFIDFNTTLIPISGAGNYNFVIRPYFTAVTSPSGDVTISNVTYLIDSTTTGYTSSDGVNFTSISNIAPSTGSGYNKNLISNGTNVFCINYPIQANTGNIRNIQFQSVVSTNFSNTYNTYTTANLVANTTATSLSLSNPIGAYGNGIYVSSFRYLFFANIPTFGMLTLFSSDAQTWTTSNIGNSYNISNILYHNNTFVALTMTTDSSNVSIGGTYNGLYTSSNGNTWTQQSIGNIISTPTETGYGFIGVNFANNFILNGYQKNANTTQYFTAYSNNAANWTVNLVSFSSNNGLLSGDRVFKTGNNQLLLTGNTYQSLAISINDGNSYTSYLGSNISLSEQTAQYYSSTGILNIGSNRFMTPTKITTYYSNGSFYQYAPIGNYSYLGGFGNLRAANTGAMWIKVS